MKKTVCSIIGLVSLLCCVHIGWAQKKIPSPPSNYKNTLAPKTNLRPPANPAPPKSNNLPIYNIPRRNTMQMPIWANPYPRRAKRVLYRDSGYVEKPFIRTDNIEVFLSAGGSGSSKSVKDNLYVLNGFNIDFGVYIPLFPKSCVDSLLVRKKGGNTPIRLKAKPNFSFGLEVGINYSRQCADKALTVVEEAYFLQGGPINARFESSAPKLSSFQLYIGPRFKWFFNRAYVSASLSGGYAFLQRNAYTISDKITNPAQTTESKYIPFLASNKYAQTGFVLKPKIELGYYITQNLSIFMNVAMIFGPELQNTIQYWEPLGNYNTNGEYTYAQYASGTAENATLTACWTTTMVNGGLAYTFNCRKKSKQ